MKLGWYPGCSLMGGSRDYAESVMAVARAFNIELKEITDWNCCGASAAHNLNKDLSLSLPARVLAQAEKDGFEEIVVPCAACYSRLSVTRHQLAADPGLAERISNIIEMKMSGRVKVLNVIQFIEKYVLADLKDKVQQPLNFKAACYYGCLMVRPHEILKFDRTEDPQSMDNVMKVLGADAIDWAYKTECCGAGMSVSRSDLVGKLSGKIIEDAIDRGAETLVVACPMCHTNLDMRRPEINKYLERKTRIPVIYLTQAIAIALGIMNTDHDLRRLFVPFTLIHKEPISPGNEKTVSSKQEEEEQ